MNKKELQQEKQYRERVASEMVRDANRRNAQKSTGPRTPEGKARSCMNATKHGMLADGGVITSGDGAESQEDFQALAARMYQCLEPVGAAEESTVEDIISLLWRIGRVRRFEAGAIRHQSDTCRADVRSEVPTIERKLQAAKRNLDDREHALESAVRMKRIVPSQLWAPRDRAWHILVERFAWRDEYGCELADEDLESVMSDLRAMGVVGTRLREAYVDARRAARDEARSVVQSVQEELLQAKRRDTLARHRAPLYRAIPDGKDLEKVLRYEPMLARRLQRAYELLDRLQVARYDREERALLIAPYRDHSS